MKQTSRSLAVWGKELDISHELYRVYVFPDSNRVVINKPRTLYVSDNGHRVVDSNFLTHYVPYGWIHLYWENDDKEEHPYRF